MPTGGGGPIAVGKGEVPPVTRATNYHGGLVKKSYPVERGGEKIGRIDNVQHRIKQGNSYTTGWTNDFKEYVLRDSTGREVRTPGNLWTLAEAKKAAADVFERGD